MMTATHTAKCDQCGKSAEAYRHWEMSLPPFGWFTLDIHSALKVFPERNHFCCKKCLLRWLIKIPKTPELLLERPQHPPAKDVSHRGPWPPPRKPNIRRG